MVQSMKKNLIALAKAIYSNTPYKPLRGFYYRTFCAMVRNRITEVSIEGVNYRLDLGETIDVGTYFNKYEPDVTAAIERLCRPGFTVLDIGANIGTHALRLARNVGELGKVYAFEPTDYAFSKLVKNVSLNDFNNITPLQIALSDKNLLQQEISFKSSWPTRGLPVERISVVDFIKLDDWCNAESVKQVDLIKLDVDGNEYSVIIGGKRLLARQHPPIIMEVWGPNFIDHAKNPFALLKEFGYRFFHIDTNNEYVSIEELRNMVSANGKLLDYSINIIAKY